ncbi:Hypothetical predicted protein [Pelobates cultripes]|uniref:Uncharacterized protein n=1 Tax=Pelobates cultripes TaxID=61616 RepID=A0AAD1RQ16_PELCU|nr:Hypothetical predicted protein [Pelobates cultripes]
MGKKSKHQGTAKPAGARDIGDLLLRPAKASSLTAPKQNGAAISASSEEQAMDELDEFPGSGGLHHPSSDENSEQPSTKGDIKALLRNLRMMFAADVATLRKEIQTVEGRVKTMEGNSEDLTARCTQLEAQNTELQRNQSRSAQEQKCKNPGNRGDSDPERLTTILQETNCFPTHTTPSKPCRDRRGLPESHQSPSTHPKGMSYYNYKHGQLN